MATDPRLRLPIGIQTFSVIREEGYYYIDKTPVIERLIQQSKYYFLSRPRRFGKSLLLDTLRCLFEGREALFQGLYLHNKWDWQTTHPVIRLSFGSGVMRNREELEQIKAKGYADKYRATGKPIHLIEVEFSRERRQIVAFEVETVHLGSCVVP